MKKAIGFLAAVAVGVSLMSASAYAAARYSAGAQTSEPGATVTVPVNIAPGTGDASASVNGYVVALTYDPDVLTPVQNGTDATSNPCYAATTFTDGVLVSDLADYVSADGKDDTVIVAWANKDAVSVDTETALATVDFKVNANTTVKSTDITVKVLSAATDANTLDENCTYVGGTITLNSAFLRGDTDGSGVIDVYDSTYIREYAAELKTLTAEEYERADANNDQTVDVYDSALIENYLAGLATIE